jgi:type I restriction enzyme S subunit
MPWPTAPLGQIMTPVSRPASVLAGKVYRLLGAHWYAKGLYVKEEKDGSEIRATKLYKVEAGDFVYNRLFAWKGAFAVATDAERGCFVSNEFPCFRVSSNLADPRWIHLYFSRHPAWTEALGLSVGGTPTSRNRLKEDRLLAMHIPLPSLPEQQRIVARIEKLAAKIEEVRHLRAEVLLETEALEIAITDSLLPEKWPRITVEELVGREQLSNGKSIKSGGDESEIHCLTLSSLRRGLIDCSDAKPVPMAAPDAEPFLVRPQDVFIVRGNGSKGLVGRAGIVQESRAGLIFPDLFIRVPLDEEKMLAEFFVAVWNSREVRHVIEEKAKTTSGIWKINQSHIASISIPLPDVSEQHRVVDRFREVSARFRLLGELNIRVGAEIEALVSSYLNEVFD